MKEHPILFNTEMVKAILEGRKTQTRRIVKPQPEGATLKSHLDGKWLTKKFNGLVLPQIEDLPMHNPFGQVGDRLWVRETFTQGYGMTLLESEGDDKNAVSIIYKADGKEIYKDCSEEVAENWGNWENDSDDAVWKPSIHMPRWASRILLEITNIRVERLQDISEDDAIAEGMIADDDYCAEEYFSKLWNEINGWDEKGWNANPWVWVIEFKVIQGGES